MGKKTVLYNARRALAETDIKYSKTAQQYMRHIAKYIYFCEFIKGYLALSLCMCVVCAQEYTDYLIAAGYAACTIHTYLAPVCRLLGINMAQINKPIRHAANFTRSRGHKKSDICTDTLESRWFWYAAFAKPVGIRRQEYAELCGRNFVQDESGHWCVEVEKGKGGKYQLQRIAPEYVDFIWSYFLRVGPNDYVFTKEEVKNHLDLHAMRAACAKDHYSRYMEMFQSDECARRRVYDEICARWERYNKRYRFRPPTWESLERPYVCRGKNREKTIAEGHPYAFDRLALLAVSIFHLSHWRVSVTVSSYMLA